MNPGDRLKAVIAAVLDELLPSRMFFAHVEYTLVRASGGTFDADPVGADYPPITNAPIRCLASANDGSTLAPGASVLVGWIGADRTKPYLVDVLENAQSLAIASTVSVSLDAPQVAISGTSVTVDGATIDVTGLTTVNSGVQPVARVGDLVLGIFPITSGAPGFNA